MTRRPVPRTLTRAFVRAGVGSAFLVAALAACSPLLAGAWAGRLHGGTAVTVVSGSMRPELPVGALIAVTPIDSARIVPGMVVTVEKPNGELVTHRVVDVLDGEGGRRVRLKGDANADADVDTWPVTSVMGQVTASLPKAGYLLSAVREPRGRLAAYGPALFVLVVVQAWAAVRPLDPEPSTTDPEALLPTAA